MSGIDDDNLRADLNALLDGALSKDRAAEMHALIESDAAVRAEYESLRRVVEAVRGLAREVAPPALQDRLRTIAAARRPAPILRWAAPLAAAAGVVVAVMLVVRDDSGHRLADEARVEKDADPIADKRGVPPEKLVENKNTAEGLVGDRADRKKDAPKPESSSRDEDAREEAKDLGDAEEAKEADKAGGEMDDGGVFTEVERPGRRQGGKKLRAKSAKPADPVAAVQAGAAIASSKELKTYLRVLSGRKQDAIVKHFRALGITPASAREREVGRGVAALSTQLSDKEEARLVAGVLKRAFPLARPEAERAKKRRVGSGGSEAKGGSAPEPSSTATVLGREGGKLILEVRLSSFELKFIRGWLDFISVAHRGRRGDLFPRARVSRGITGSAIVTRRRVELHYPLPKRAGTETADD